jgi:hypothetical protein
MIRRAVFHEMAIAMLIYLHIFHVIYPLPESMPGLWVDRYNEIAS